MKTYAGRCAVSRFLSEIEFARLCRLQQRDDFRNTKSRQAGKFVGHPIAGPRSPHDGQTAATDALDLIEGWLHVYVIEVGLI
jgi:hypothetical protein